MKKFYLSLAAILLVVTLLTINCQKVSVAHITFNNIGKYEAVVKVEESYEYLIPGNSFTFEIGFGGSYTTVKIRAYPKSNNPKDYYRGLTKTVPLYDGDHKYFNVDVVPVDELDE